MFRGSVIFMRVLRIGEKWKARVAASLNSNHFAGMVRRLKKGSSMAAVQVGGMVLLAMAILGVAFRIVNYRHIITSDYAVIACLAVSGYMFYRFGADMDRLKKESFFWRLLKLDR